MQTPEEKRTKFQNNIGNYLFLAFMFGGMALGKLVDAMSMGTLCGMALGFAAYGITLFILNRK